MRNHRSAHPRFFTTLGNGLLRDSRLSFCARGVLGYLLSLPDGQSADIRTLADRAPEGRERVAAALRELERFGYLRRTKKRTPQGRIYTEVDVYDTPHGLSPQAEPHAGVPGPGAPLAGPDGDHPVKEREEKPTLPPPPPPPAPPPSVDEEPGREGSEDPDTTASARVLARIARAEPKLALGRRDTHRLAPLVTEWRRRGATDLHLINALTAGLPRDGVHHPARFLETRLRGKMPPEPATAPARPECHRCRAPLATSGLCYTCCKPEPCETPDPAAFAQARARGIALARAALRGIPHGAPAALLYGG